LNEHLWQIAEKKPIIQQIKERKWVQYSLRKDSQAIDKFSIGTLRDDIREENL
jgi:hypothetical protein